MQIILLLFASMITSNIALTYFLGMCPFVTISRKIDVAAGMGMAVTLVMTLTAADNWLINTYILVRFDLLFLQFLVFIVTIDKIVQILEIVIDRFFPTLYQDFGIFLPLITMNCAILGVSLFMNLRSYSFIQTLAYSFGSGIGRLLAIITMGELRKSLVYSRPLKNFKDAGITAILAGIMTQGGKPLLRMLFENKYFITSACGGKGTCGYCKLKVLEGGGPMMPTEALILSPAEQAQFYRLACRLKAKNDLSIEIPAEYLEIQEYEGQIVLSEPVTPDIKRVRIKLISSRSMDYKPGQYIQVKIPFDGTTEFRAHSMASNPDTKNGIEINVKLIPGGIGSTYMHELNEDDSVEFSGPYGDFFLKTDSRREIVCVAGGVGLAPLKSIVRYWENHAVKRKLWLYYDACSACHSRHDFSLAQARAPETCGRCHLGPDHPRKEVYESSKQAKTHDIGRRISWNLRMEISYKTEDAETKRKAMQEVCMNRHNPDYAENFYTQFDAGDFRICYEPG